MRLHIYPFLCLLFFTLGTNVVFGQPLNLKQDMFLEASGTAPYLILAHSWKKAPKKEPHHHDDHPPDDADHPNEAERSYYQKDNDWHHYPHERRKKTYRFGGGSRYLSRKKSRYYSYNYDKGYLTDNCEYIRAPKRVCFYDRSDNRRCVWRLKWQYKCF